MDLFLLKFDFDIVNFPFLDGDVPRRASYGVYISQLIRFARVCNHVADFNARNKCFQVLCWVKDAFRRGPFGKVQVGNDQEKAQSEKRFPLQKPRWEKTKLTIRYLYHEPEFYGDLVYKFKKLIGRNDFSFQFRKIITRYRCIGYNLCYATVCMLIFYHS